MDQNLIISLAGIVISGLVAFVVSSFRIGVYKNKVDTAKDDIKELKTDAKEVRDKVVACETAIFKEPLLRKKSPVDLTEKGDKVLAESGGKKFIDDNYPELKKKVEDKNPKTYYDFQEYSKSIINEMRSDERLNDVKQYLFKEGMELGNFVEVLGIYLRNLIFKEKKISLDNLDTNKEIEVK